MKKIKGEGVEVVIYEPSFKEDEFLHSQVMHDLEAFKKVSDVIMANRHDSVLDDVKEKVYTRDIFGSD
jgi:UDPglucose 6-dehydrogenase